MVWLIALFSDICTIITRKLASLMHEWLNEWLMHSSSEAATLTIFLLNVVNV